jgi:hypothetical protein
MVRLLKLVVYLGAIVGFIWFGTTVKLGQRTLFQHVRNIWHTHESQELVEGTKGKVGELVEEASDKVVNRVGQGVTAPATSRGETPEPKEEWPMEDVESEDRETLRGLIGRKTKSK